MSCPHVAGVAAKHMSGSTGHLTPAEIKQIITSTANMGYISGVPTGGPTPNALLYSECV